MYFNRSSSLEGQSAGQGSVCRKPDLVQRVLQCPFTPVEQQDCPWCFIRNGELCLPPCWDLFKQLPMVGLWLWQLPQYHLGLQGALLKGSVQVPVDERRKGHSRDMAVSLICVSFFVLLLQPINQIMCLKIHAQVIVSSGAVCLVYQCWLESTWVPRGRLQAIGPIQSTPLIHFHQQIELAGDFRKSAWAGGCSILLGRAGDSHNSYFQLRFPRRLFTSTANKSCYRIGTADSSVWS